MSFESLGLDPRLLRALDKRDYVQPSPVQAACIPKALEGKDIIARARTGSGKTLAYVLPALQKLLTLPPEQQKAPWQVLILVPTRELCNQVKEEADSIASVSGLDIRVSALTATGIAAQRDQFLHIGQIVVSTPGRIAQALKEGKLRPQILQPQEGLRPPGLSTLILDEADLILSMPGYDEDLQAIAPKVPRGCQCLLMSATTNESVERLQKLVLHNPVMLDLLAAAGPSTGRTSLTASAGPGSADEIEHFSIHCSKNDKLLYVMTMLKLGLVRTKMLLFVNSIEAGFRLRLFLESFGIRTAVINAELPLNSRHHILQEFNRGIIDYLIATDDPRTVEQEKGVGPPVVDEKKGRGSKGKKRKRPEADSEFGVTRGVDFKGVATVINVDAPPSVAGYVHRVGRTGRAGNSGTAVTLFTPADADLEESLTTLLPAADQPEPGQLGAGAEEAASGSAMRPFSKLSQSSVEALRYRGEDIARSLTSKVVNEARAKELRLELINSQRLATHFEEHPGDLALLKHDKALARAPEAPHLKHLPPYLRAAGMPATTGPGGVLSGKKRRKQNKGVDPIKGGFVRAPKRGTGSEPLTEMEQKAEKYGKKVAKKEAKKARQLEYIPKRNVRKKR